MEWFSNHVRKAHEGGPNAERELNLALVSLVGLCGQQAQIKEGDSERLRRFRQESSEALMNFKNYLAAYTALTINLTEAAGEDDWYELCIRRSVIQCLLDDFAGAPIAKLIDPAEVSELDAELRRVGREYGPVLPPFVPPDLADNHWWWFYPLSEKHEEQE